MRKPSATLLFVFSIWALLTAISTIPKFFHSLATYKGNSGYMTNYMSGYTAGEATRIILLFVLAVLISGKAKKAGKQIIVA
ncbi:hypothetical protein [Mucilaginibacter sp. L196]|uniref:hypothetical protein n=1 Tax=Mucilaginibacter sp. L196 TaxID=1641870 RepID=UPI00131AE55A|nr:hypothetical protein [Mucilaginibacter sp. L196]